MRPVVAAVVAVGLTLSVSQMALASSPTLQPGVHVDPGSPAGKEYQIPVVGARGEAAGGTQGQGGNPPLFGVGVTPATTASADSSAGNPAAAGSGAGGAGSHSARTAGSRAHSRPQTVASSPTAVEPASAVAPPDPGGSGSAAGGNGWIALVAGGLLVLVLGGGGGLVLRQRVLRS